MYQNQTIITQSSNPVLPLSLVKGQCLQDSTVGTLDDQLLGLYLASAVRLAESYTKKTLDTKQYLLRLDAFPGSHSYGQGHPGLSYASRLFNVGYDSFRLPQCPLISVDQISYTTAAGSITVPSSSYVYVPGCPGRIGPAYGAAPFYNVVNQNIGSLQITYTAGYGIPDPVTGMLGLLPENIIAGVLLLTAHLYLNREATSEHNLSAIPFGVKELFDSGSSGFYI